jgi:hypothetical protein
MMKANGLRDVGQQETAHLNIHLPIVWCSNSFVRVITNQNGRVATEFISAESISANAGFLSKKSLFECYLCRLEPILWDSEGAPRELEAIN